MYKLKKDIVIKAGTVLDIAPWKTTRSGDHYDCLIGLTDNTCGVFTYDIDPSDIDNLNEWFEEV